MMHAPNAAYFQYHLIIYVATTLISHFVTLARVNYCEGEGRSPIHLKSYPYTARGFLFIKLVFRIYSSGIIFAENWLHTRKTTSENILLFRLTHVMKRRSYVVV